MTAKTVSCVAFGLLFSAHALMSLPEATAQTGPQAATQAAEPVTEAPKPPPVPGSPALVAAINEYNSQPDPAQFERIAAALRDLLSHPQFGKADAQSILKANPGMAELGVRVFDVGGARLFAFPKATYANSVIIAWQHVSTVPQGPAVRGRRPPVVHVGVPKAQIIPISPGISITGAKIIQRTVVEPAAAGQARRPAAALSRNLILAGSDRTKGTVWLKALKPADGNWFESPDVLSAIPPFLLQNVEGKAGFSGSDLILNIAPQKAADDPQARKPGQTQSGSYRIVLRLVNGKYAMEGKLPEGPLAVVQQFVNAVQQGRQDIAKAWLTDGKLASIPGYLGLYGRNDKPFRIISMASPPSGASRYRIITFGKNDLIADVGLIKRFEAGKARQFHAIKALFVAPQDPFAQKLIGVAPGLSVTGQVNPPPQTDRPSQAATGSTGAGH